MWLFINFVIKLNDIFYSIYYLIIAGIFYGLLLNYVALFLSNYVSFFFLNYVAFFYNIVILYDSNFLKFLLWLFMNFFIYFFSFELCGIFLSIHVAIFYDHYLIVWYFFIGLYGIFCDILLLNHIFMA